MAELQYQDHSEHLEQLEEALNIVFPVLCFNQNDISSLMEEVQTPYNYKFMRIERAPGQAALVCANPGRGDKPWDLKYLIPTQWAPRYPIIQAAIKRLTDEVTRLDAPGLYMTVKEDPPSHNAYFSAILGLAGFELEPRARFLAPLNLIDKLTPPVLPNDIEEIGWGQFKSAEAADAYIAAFAEYNSSPSSRELGLRRSSQKEYIEELFDNPRCANSWTALKKNGQLIGICVGSEDERSKTLDIIEIGVRPGYRGLNLGRYLFIRCMQKLHAHRADADRRFFVGTFRTWIPAMRLYQKIGFNVDSVESYATFKLPRK